MTEATREEMLALAKYPVRDPGDYGIDLNSYARECFIEGYRTAVPPEGARADQAASSELSPLHLKLLQRGARYQYIGLSDDSMFRHSELSALGDLHQMGLAERAKGPFPPGPPRPTPSVITQAGRDALAGLSPAVAGGEEKLPSAEKVVSALRIGHPILGPDKVDLAAADWIERLTVSLSAHSARVKSQEEALREIGQYAKRIRKSSDLVGPVEYAHDSRAMKVWQRALYHEGKTIDGMVKAALCGSELFEPEKAATTLLSSSDQIQSTTEPMPEVWEEWHLEKPGQPAHIIIVDTHRQPVPSAIARAYWLAKIDREYPL